MTKLRSHGAHFEAKVGPGTVAGKRIALLPNATLGRDTGVLHCRVCTRSFNLWHRATNRIQLKKTNCLLSILQIPMDDR